MRILEAKNIPLALVLKKLLQSQDRGFVIKSLAKRTMELAEALKKCENPEELYRKLLDLGVNDLTASMIVDVAPRSIDEVRILLGFETSNISDDVLSTILDLVSNYCYTSS